MIHLTRINQSQKRLVKMALSRIGTHLLNASLETEPALVKYHNEITKPVHFVHVMGAKEDRFALSSAEIAKAQQLCHDLAAVLKGEGHRAMATETNLRYRTEIENWQSFFPPDISHRYLAVASGAGSFGWSGNVGVKGYGTAVALATVITDVGLEPTAPIPEEESFCSNCKACARACPVGMFSETEKTSVTIGGRQFTHAARIDWARCGISCAGITGLHKSKKWSSWSPGRYEIPEDKNEFYQMIQRGTTAREQWPPMEGETVFSIGENSKHGSEGAYEISFTQTCQHCSLRTLCTA